MIHAKVDYEGVLMSPLENPIDPLPLVITKKFILSGCVFIDIRIQTECIIAHVTCCVRNPTASSGADELIQLYKVKSHKSKE